MITREKLLFAKLIFALLILCVLMDENLVLAAKRTAHTPGNPQEIIDPEDLDSFLDQYIPEQMKISHVPGLVLTIVQGDEVILSKGYGYADLENKIPMTPQTNIRAGSVSKSLTATAVIMLVEQGVLDLDAPVSEYISDIDLEDEYGTASSIRQLLNHMSGYPDTLLLSHSPGVDDWEPLSDVLRGDLPRRAFPPGLVSAYSDWNFSLLGYAIEGATGQPYEEAIEDLIFESLGMENSTYAQPLPEEVHKNMAVGYGWNYSKYRYDIVPHDFVRMSPGIALVTNGEDMGSYMKALLNDGSFGGYQIFGDETLAMLLERQGSAHAYSRGWSYAFVENTISGRSVLYKDGNGIGFTSRVVLIPDQDLGIFVSTNHRNLGEGLWLTQAAAMTTRTLLTAIVENFVPETEIDILDVQPLSDRADSIQRYTGHYQKAGISCDDFFKLEGLLDNVDVKDNGDGTLRISSGIYQEVEPFVFQNMDSPGFFVIFVENQLGKVEFLTFGGTGSYQKVGGYQHKNFQIILVAAIALISLVMLITWPITRQGHWMAWVVSLLDVGFLVGVGLLFVSSVTDMLIFFKTIPIEVRILFTIPWLIGILSISLPVFLVLMWRESDVSWWGRIHYTLLTVFSFALVWWANFWNLIWK